MISLPTASWSRGSGWYCDAHPTNYQWRDDVHRLLVKYLNAPSQRGHISINTYYDHPPGWHRDATSADFWAWPGRGSPLAYERGASLHRMIFNDLALPYIDWIIYYGRMWTRAGGWQAAPWGPPGSDAGHWQHIHVTFL